MNAKKVTNILALLVVIGFAVYFFIPTGSDQTSDDADEADDGSGWGDNEVSEDDQSENYFQEEVSGGGVSSSNEEAVEVGMDILENGGNAVDAAVAISFTLNVTEPYGSGVGGGGAMVYMPSPEETPVVYDYRETASSTNPRDVVGVPGFVKGMQTFHEKEGGNLEVDELLDPAIQYAEEGIPVSNSLFNRINNAREAGRLSPEQSPHFFPDGQTAPEGSTIVQQDLANVLKTLKENGLNDFYEGEIAQKIIATYPHISQEDLSNYSIKVSEAASGQFEDNTVYSAPPPLSGVTLIQMLGMAEKLNAEKFINDEAQYMNLFSEITRQAYNDRLGTYGDPDFFNNKNNLTSDEKITELAKKANTRDDLNVDTEVTAMDDPDRNHTNTTHFVVMDDEGRTVSTTNTLGNFFGSGQMVDGMWMNSQLLNFSENLDSPNSIEQGKRPRSFISPTIIKNDNSGQVMGIGTPGGTRIPSIISQFILRQQYLDESFAESMEATRFAPYYSSMEEQIYLDIEDFDQELTNNDPLVTTLTESGYQVRPQPITTYFGSISALAKDYKNQEIIEITDTRRNGIADSTNE
ncbi:gamma-glutamyltransferase family protein [Alteribacillus sp. HJP-4]|uniref:gamma-glutamyltransferase family protein n=1 Tax=Alteribacillus sp. HJP-4 TaxID=2775394 RepID=UPI0035CCF81D